MATKKRIQLDAIGVDFKYTVKEDGVARDISSATVIQMKFKKPDGSVITRTGAFVNTGTDGLIRYVSIASDLDQVGFWERQAYLVMTGYTGHTKATDFEVFPNL